MGQAFIIVFREGFEAFLIAAIIFAYLQKTGQKGLLPAVGWGIGASILASVLLGLLVLEQANEPLWESVFGLVSAVLIACLVVHMWRTAPRLKQDMEGRLAQATAVRSSTRAWMGVFLFTTLMIAREGMETALLLIQVHDPRVVSGALLGITGAVAMALMWVRVGHLINLKVFFQVTSVFLLLFVAQILLYSFHEITELGILPNSEMLHKATEIFSSDGVLSQWLTTLMVATCGLWFVIAWGWDRLRRFRSPELGMGKAAS